MENPLPSLFLLGGFYTNLIIAKTQEKKMTSFVAKKHLLSNSPFIPYAKPRQDLFY